MRALRKVLLPAKNLLRIYYEIGKIDISFTIP